MPHRPSQWSTAAQPKFHNLRNTSAFLWVHKGVAAAITQRPLEHSRPQPPYDMYTNTDPMLPQAIKLSALAGWLWEQSTARRVFDSLTSPAFITLCNR
jgi:hypothetical protein